MVLFGLTQALGGGQSAVDPFGEVDRRLSVEQRHPADLLQARPHELGRIGARVNDYCDGPTENGGRVRDPRWWPDGVA